MDGNTLNRIMAVVGLDGVSTATPDLLVYSTDQWPRNSVLRLLGRVAEMKPDAIVWPRSTEAVSEVVRICDSEGVPVIPYGGGSGVCGGTVVPHGGIILDLKRMNGLVSVDELSMTAVAEAGILGQHLESALNERGFTLGHFPSSIMCSTVGGWAATRSAGQFSSRYGKIEDMVVGLDVVLPDGTITSIDGTQAHPGAPDICQLLMGSEGTLGVIVRARLRLFPTPFGRRMAGFRFMELTSGLEAMRSIMQRGLRPTVMRLYDPLDTLLNGLSADREERPAETGLVSDLIRRVSGGDVRDAVSALTGPLLKQFLAVPAVFQHTMARLPLSCQLVLGFEGEADRTRGDIEAATELALRAEGQDLGPGPGEYWYRHRYDVSHKLTKVFNKGAFAETIEVAGLWRDVARIYRDVRHALMGRVGVMAHFSHAYREGCAIYFTMAGWAASPRGLLDLYDWAVRMAIGQAMKAGATMSHHHGVGYMKRAYVPEEYRGGERVFWSLKQAMDPSGIMNPRKIYPPFVPFGGEDGAGTRPRQDNDEFTQLVSWDFHARMPREVSPEVPEEIPELFSLARERGRTIACQGGHEPARDKAGRDPALVVLDLSRLDAILEMDPISGTVTVQAGLWLQQLENFLREQGFTLGFIPRSRRHLSIGEYIATAAPAEGSPLYGTIRTNCIGISAVLPDGTLFSARPAPRRSAGPDLMSCFIGAHGRYGVITAACFRIFPVPPVREAVAYGMDDPVVAVSAVRTILVRQATPEWVLIVIRAPSEARNRRRVRVVMQFGGTREAVSADMTVVRSVMESLGVEGEAVRAEDRMTQTGVRAPAIQRFLAMDEVMDLAERIGADEDSACPEAHITDLATHGATFRLLLRKDTHRFQPDIQEVLCASGIPEPVAAMGDRLKNGLDPDGLLNPGPGSDSRDDKPRS